MTKLSVNINKFATLRNARGGNNPDVLKAALDCERFGAEGITVHPRPDQRHIRFDDVLLLSQNVSTEFNIEGYPDGRFLEIIEKAKPAQATLVPDRPDAITSSEGWDTFRHEELLSETIASLKNMGVRTSIFIAPDKEMIKGAAQVGTDRIELYTEAYASGFAKDKEASVLPYVESALFAEELGLEVNAGHDLDLHNLSYFYEKIPNLKEVSIGHALVCDALYHGLENTIQLYLRQLS